MFNSVNIPGHRKCRPLAKPEQRQQKPRSIELFFPVHSMGASTLYFLPSPRPMDSLGPVSHDSMEHTASDLRGERLEYLVPDQPKSGGESPVADHASDVYDGINQLFESVGGPR